MLHLFTNLLWSTDHKLGNYWLVGSVNWFNDEVHNILVSWIRDKKTTKLAAGFKFVRNDYLVTQVSDLLQSLYQKIDISIVLVHYWIFIQPFKQQIVNTFLNILEATYLGHDRNTESLSLSPSLSTSLIFLVKLKITRKSRVANHIIWIS